MKPSAIHKTRPDNAPSPLKDRDFHSEEFPWSQIRKGGEGVVCLKVLSVDEVNDAHSEAEKKIKKLGLDKDDPVCEQLKIGFNMYAASKLKVDDYYYPMTETVDDFLKALSPDELTVLQNAYSQVVRNSTLLRGPITDPKELAVLILDMKEMEREGFASILEKKALFQFSHEAIVNLLLQTFHLIDDEKLKSFIEDKNAEPLDLERKD